ncbi:MAG TPA: CDP-alcohol phosphatidyltransferase family protein [Nitrososphaerales archaeon]|nr:CDP-alcohol phosphatidyltransferase family protein [Nitrososphaerales archaeon]
MLDRLRGSLSGVLSSLGRGAAKVVPSPTAWTLVGTLFAFVSFFFYRGDRPLLGGLMVLLSGFFDILDGAVARATKRTSARGAFLDSTLDRVAELAIYLGILVGNYTSPALVLVALASSLLVSYTRAKGDALGVNLAGIGVGERSERLAVLIVASFLHLVGIGVLVVAVLAIVTFAERTIRVSRALAPKVAPVGSPGPVPS